MPSSDNYIKKERFIDFRIEIESDSIDYFENQHPGINVRNNLINKMNSMMDIYVTRLITRKYYNKLLNDFGFNELSIDSDVNELLLKENFINIEYNILGDRNEGEFIINPSH